MDLGRNAGGFLKPSRDLGFKGLKAFSIIMLILFSQILSRNQYSQLPFWLANIDKISFKMSSIYHAGENENLI